MKLLPIISRRQFVSRAILSGVSRPFLLACQEAESLPQLSVPGPAEQKRLGAQAAAQILGKTRTKRSRMDAPPFSPNWGPAW